ncbi:cytochrome c [Sphingomonas sp. AP4-R1]|uniref:cytochrome c n=1 Tax=Sphingomonas sp. AP4-R1 TaxID=2735134 RepID=UPI001493309B|nr:cytochrome c [Sphingomonas sp. AP4-R1]QJU58343.1 cytochrome c [Sphingomonas sp. AP4-R1]
MRQLARSARNLLGLTAGLCSIAGLAACHRSAPVSEGPKPHASIRDIMLYEIDPAADFVWESVSTDVTSEGVKEHQPHTTAEWQTVQSQALRLAEAPNLLVVPGRRVAHGGQSLDDVDAPGNLTAEQIEQKIVADPALFARLAADLQTAALKAVDAAKAHNSARLSDAGAAIDAACESCHRTYWYPGEADYLRAHGVTR